MATPTENLSKLGIKLPEAPEPVAAYINCVRTGNLLHISGGLPFASDGTLITGQVPRDISPEAAQEAARLIIINRLAVVEKELGSIDKVSRIVSLSGFVSSAPDFYNHPLIINGASELLLEIFEERGQHSRIALGVSALPLNAAVEIGLIVECED